MKDINWPANCQYEVFVVVSSIMFIGDIVESM